MGAKLRRLIGEGVSHLQCDFLAPRAPVSFRKPGFEKDYLDFFSSENPGQIS